jgi:hypothetical protein
MEETTLEVSGSHVLLQVLRPSHQPHLERREAILSARRHRGAANFERTPEKRFMSELLIKRRKFYDFFLTITIEKDLEFSISAMSAGKSDEVAKDSYGHSFEVDSIELAFLVFETLLTQIEEGNYEPPTKLDWDQYQAGNHVDFPVLHGIHATLFYTRSSH